MWKIELCLPRITLDPYRLVGVLDVTIGKEEIGNIVGKLKRKKAAGCDGLKPELYKALAGSEVVIESLERGFGRVLELEEVPEGWKRSRTVMIPKKKRPTEADLRPIAMTDISYKMLISILRGRLEEHIEVNGMRKDEQVGFTEGGNISDCLFVLRECVEEVFRMGEHLVVVAVDFKKAYDLVKRDTLLEFLKEYRVAGDVIELFKSV